MNRMFQELHLGRAPTASHSSMDRFPTLKIDFKEFSGEPEDWNTWSRVHHAQLSALGCADALTAEGDDDIKIGAGGYEDGNYDPVKLRAAHQAWVSLMTTCKGVAFEIVQGAESPGKAWSRLVQHYRASGLKERRRLTVDFYTMKMELGEHPRKFLLRVDQMVKELERVERPVDPKDVDIVILSGLTSQYDAEVRMLESSSDWPTREWIERAVINQYDRLKSEQSAAGNHAMLAGRGNGHDSKPSPPRCPLCSRTGHTAKGCREYVVTKRDHKPNGHQGGNSKNGGNKHNKRRGEKGKSQHKDGSKLIRAGCYFCEGPHKSEDCPHRLESTAAPAESQPKHGGFIGSVRRSLNSGMIASIGSGSALTANVTIQRQDEVWVGDSGATEHMTQDPSGLEDYELAPVGQRVEVAGGTHLPIAGYGSLRLLVDQGLGDFRGPARELALERVAHVPNLGQHNLLSVKRLAQSFDAPMRFYPAAAVIRPRRGGKPLIFRPLRPEYGLLEIKVRRHVATYNKSQKKTDASSLVVARRGPRDIMEFHRTLGHPGEEITRQTARMAGIQLSGTWSPCVHCSEARVRRYAVPKSTDCRDERRAGRLFVDLSGPFHETSLAGMRYAMLCVDDFSRYKFVRFLRKKSDATEGLRDIINDDIAPQGLQIGIVRTDGGGEFDGQFQTFLSERGIKRERTPPHTPQYNGVAERALGILRDKTVALLRGVTEGKSDRLWAEAMNFACQMSNRCVTSSLSGSTSPYELWFGRRPQLDNIPTFGALGYLRRFLPEHKLAPRGAKCIMLGLAEGFPRETFRVRDLNTGKVLFRQAVTWHPPPSEEPRSRSPGSATKHRRHVPRHSGITGFTPQPGHLETIPETNEEGETSNQPDEEPEHGDSDAVSDVSDAASDVSEVSEVSDESGEDQDDEAREVTAAVRKLYNSFTGMPYPLTESRTRSGRTNDHDASSTALHTVDYRGNPSRHLDPEPTNISEARASPEWPHWETAIKRELDGQIARGVWQLTDRPKGKTVLGTKMVFKRKLDQHGRIEKYKCRLVAQGFRQVKGVHYIESSSPTPAQASIRMVFGIIATLGWEARQLDVDMAYLEADVEEEIYIELPETCRESKSQVGLLKKAMYGLIHAGLLWSKKFGTELKKKGFERSQADPCVFRRVLRGRVVVIIVVYVDDLLVVSASKRDEEQALEDLHSCFPIKDLGEPSHYLGYSITRDRDAGTLKVDQRQYVQEIAERFGITKTSAIPTAAGRKALSKADGPQTDAEVDEMRQVPYREAVGALMWAATMTRPDISYAAHQLAKFNENPGPAHWKAVKKALQYLWRTKDMGITYGKEPGGNIKLSAWVDADYGTCPDTRRSVSGGAVMMGKGAISWFSRIQKATAAASSEAEYVALSEIVNEIRFLRQVKEFMAPPIDTDIQIHEDNEGAIKMAKNRFSSKRTRHVDVKHHIVRDTVEEGVVDIKHVRSEEQHADVLTKALDVKTFERHARFLMNSK